MKSKLKKAVLAAGTDANCKVLHPDDHSHVVVQSPLENDRRVREEEAPFEKKRKLRGSR